MLRDFRNWLGPERVQIIVGTLIFTGLASIALGLLVNADWVSTVQSLLALAFIAIATVLIGGRMGVAGRRRLFFTIGPALAIGVLALFLPGNIAPFVLGGAFGWLIAAQFFIREPILMEYRVAIRHMRDKDYKAAIAVIDKLLKSDPQNLEHLDFRARLHQLNKKTPQAIKDYERMIEIQADDPRGYSGLSGIYVQRGDFEQARHYSLQTLAYAEHNPAATHDLALIEDRLGNSEAVINYVERSFEYGMKESRLLLLSYLWLVRAYTRLGEEDAADAALKKLKQQRQGLREWQRIIEDEQSETVRGIYAADVALAAKAIEFDMNAARPLFEEA